MNGCESPDDWQAESDARTMAQAHEIKKDSQRFKKAVDASKRMADEKMQEAKHLQKMSQGMSASGNTDKKWPDTAGVVTGRR